MNIFFLFDRFWKDIYIKAAVNGLARREAEHKSNGFVTRREMTIYREN